jgi:hypothetical protein
MNYANVIHSLGAIVVIIYAIMKIFHLEHEQINVNLLLTLGFVLGYFGQSWKIRLLEKEIKDSKIQTPAQ